MIPNITEAEERVMRALWGAEPMALGEVADRLRDAGWSSKTVKTLIDRLCEKGAVGVERWGRRNRYYALLEKDAFARKQIGSLVDRLFDGSPQDLLAFFCRTQELTPKQARELIEMLESGEEAP